MRRYILTGAPGGGKATIAYALAQRGYPVIGEAATDVVAREQERGVEEPWREPGFVDAVIRLQQQRQQKAPLDGGAMQVYDRSPICTLALARYLELPVTRELRAEVNRVVQSAIYQPMVFFVQRQADIESTSDGEVDPADPVTVATPASPANPVGSATPVGPVGSATPVSPVGSADVKRFEELHRAAYETCGYELVDVPPGAISDRVDLIDEALQADDVRYSEEAWNF
ncbi:AAA family ATPase [Cryptosporangium minutisporangium]|uniref:AAA family ATPase n=1 Tax=Cryptosporangium minutisporangium TaxID=113569 RepID=A0ABP6STB0_9ACTN